MQLATVPAGAVAVVQHYAMLRKRGAAARGARRDSRSAAVRRRGGLARQAKRSRAQLAHAQARGAVLLLPLPLVVDLLLLLLPSGGDTSAMPAADTPPAPPAA